MTPRGYISWSSLDLLERSVEKWKERYLYGEKSRTNRGQALGKLMADSLEQDVASGDPVLDLVITRIPKLEIMDRVLEDEKGDWVEVNHNGKMERYQVPVLQDGKIRIPLVAKPDTARADYSAFKEYKTGQAPWTKKKAQEHGQMHFYAAAIFVKTRRLPGDVELVHVETGKKEVGQFDATLAPTGEIYRYPVVITMSHVLNMMVRIKRAWAIMEKVTEEELL